MCTSLPKSSNVFKRLISIYKKIILILWHCPLTITKLPKSNSATSEKVFWFHFRFWTMLIASMIHVVFFGKHSVGGESFSRKIKSGTLFVLCSETSLVAKDHGMWRSEWVQSCPVVGFAQPLPSWWGTYQPSGWLLSQTSKQLISLLLFYNFCFINYLPFSFSFIRGSVSKNCVSQSLNKRLLLKASVFKFVTCFFAYLFGIA